jgi:hypothetical protein
VQLYVLGFVHHTHPAAAQFLDDPVVRDVLPDHVHTCYGGRVGKSMQGVESVFAKNLITPVDLVPSDWLTGATARASLNARHPVQSPNRNRNLRLSDSKYL